MSFYIYNITNTLQRVETLGIRIKPYKRSRALSEEQLAGWDKEPNRDSFEVRENVDGRLLPYKKVSSEKPEPVIVKEMKPEPVVAEESELSVEEPKKPTRKSKKK